MRLRTLFNLCAAAAFSLALAGTAPAQDWAQGEGSAEARGKAEYPTNATGPRTSPFEPPEANDRSFVTDAAAKLDTGCIYRNGGPILYNIEITRHVGELNADGTLKRAAALVAAGLLSPKATLIMPAFDVDSNAVTNFAPERDRVSFNGEEIGYLSGENNLWKLNRFEIPIEKVRFAARGANGSEPAPALNEIRIDIDTANSELVWCTSVDWGSQSFKAMSPVILIHGNNSDGGFFDRQGFTAELKANNLLYDNSIDLTTNPVAVNAGDLNNLIPPVVKSFGVDSVHFVVHSKGGLDSREYLATYQPAHEQEFKVLSYTSLSTPHNGSVGADVLVARDLAARQADKVEFSGFPTFSRQVAALLSPDEGTPDLTTWAAAAFNSRNLPRLSSDTVFNTVAADADRNGNGRIDRFFPDEFAALRAESLQLRILDSLHPVLGPLASRAATNFPYQILRNSAGLTLTYRTERTLLGGTRTVATIKSIPNPSPLGNDVLVTIPSGRGAGTLDALTGNTFTFTGPAGRNHSNVADRGVAARVIPWIIGTERSRGDLR